MCKESVVVVAGKGGGFVLEKYWEAFRKTMLVAHTLGDHITESLSLKARTSVASGAQKAEDEI